MTARALIAALGLLLTHAMPAHAGVDRPPQFIVMAFDNCTELERWQELTDFAADMNRDGDRVHFTFFVSGINFIADGKRNIYEVRISVAAIPASVSAARPSRFAGASTT
jgi:hypothetical protein